MATLRRLNGSVSGDNYRSKQMDVSLPLVKQTISVLSLKKSKNGFLINCLGVQHRTKL